LPRGTKCCGVGCRNVSGEIIRPFRSMCLSPKHRNSTVSSGNVPAAPSATIAMPQPRAGSNLCPLPCDSFRWSQSKTPSRDATVRERFPSDRSHTPFHPAPPEAALSPVPRPLSLKRNRNAAVSRRWQARQSVRRLLRSHSPPPSTTGTMWSASHRLRRLRRRSPQQLSSRTRCPPRERFRSA